MNTCEAADIDEKSFNCLQCDYKCKSSAHLRSHVLNKHTDIKDAKVVFSCNQCKARFKTNGALKMHMLFIHTDLKDVKKTYNCDKCDSKFKCNSHLKNHIKRVHVDINQIQNAYNCTICDSKFKSAYELNRHGLIHIDIKNVKKIFKCTYCDVKVKTNDELKSHILYIHTSIEDCKVIYECPNCQKKFKTKSNLRQHLQNAHDQGDKKCQYCLSNVFNIQKYEDTVLKQTVYICTKCYKTKTNFKTRKEHRVVNQLMNTRYKDYIVLQDQIIKGDICQTKKRPDILISSNKDNVFLLEVDEHSHDGYDQSCEDGRLNEILNELKESRVTILRLNPDDCKTNNVSLNERVDLLVKLLDVLIKKEWTERDTIMIYYLFYNQESEAISKTFKYKFINFDADM